VRWIASSASSAAGLKAVEQADRYVSSSCPWSTAASAATVNGGQGEAAGRRECRLQRALLLEAIRELVLDDQRLRNDICWSVFDC
jgi:hypothetical protein